MGAEALSGAGGARPRRSGAGSTRAGTGRGGTGAGGGAGRTGASAGSGRAGAGLTKARKPRPGTGGYGKRRLEGKGPTPPAHMRPGHPAQRKAAKAAKAAAKPSSTGPNAKPSGGPGDGGGNRNGPQYRGGGVAGGGVGRNAVLESLRAGVPATALHVGPRLDPDERIGEAVMLATDAGIPVVEAGRAELDRITGGAAHQGLGLRIRAYKY